MGIVCMLIEIHHVQVTIFLIDHGFVMNYLIDCRFLKCVDSLASLFSKVIPSRTCVDGQLILSSHRQRCK